MIFSRLLAATLLLGMTIGYAAPFTLVRDGAPAATIVLAPKATRAAQMAAIELRHHVALIAGADLPVVTSDNPVDGPRILVGDSPLTAALGLHGADFPSQEYLVRVGPETIVLLGRDKQDFGEVRDLSRIPQASITWPSVWDDQGTLYAAYDFLERGLGVRWFNPSEAGTVVEERSTVEVPVQEVRRAPSMRYRGGTWWNTYTRAVLLWRRDSDGYRAYQRAAFPSGGVGDAYNPAVEQELNALFLLRVRAGGEKSLCNHSMYDYYERFWEPKPNGRKFEGKRPEFFAQGYPGTPQQLCYTNEALVQQVAADGRAYFDEGGYPNPPGSGHGAGYQWGERFFAVEPMDGGLGCRCENCRKWYNHDGPVAGRDSNYHFQFVNRVARELAKSHPEKKVSTLAYGAHEMVPDRVTLDPNVAVHFCFHQNRLAYNHAAYAAQLANLAAWRAESDRDLYLWLYYTFPKEIADNGRFFCFPGFFAHTIGEQFKVFRQNDIKGIFHCGYGQEVEAYVTFRLMADWTLDVNALLDEYFTGLYGPAGEPLRQMYDLVEQTYGDIANYPEGFEGHQRVTVAWEDLGTAERVARMGELMARAEQLATTAAQRQRVKLWKLGIYDYIKTGREQYVERQQAYIPKITVPRLPAAGGRPEKLDWSGAVALDQPWYERGGSTPADRAYSGRVAHDGEYLYLELSDPVDPAKLHVSGMVFAYDDWEIFVAGQRAVPYRQYAVGPTGLTVALSHGEENFRLNVPIPEYDMRVHTVAGRPGVWTTQMAWPLARMLPAPLAPGDAFYMNIIRVTRPELTNGKGIGIDTWISHCTVHEVDRLAELNLAQ